MQISLCLVEQLLEEKDFSKEFFQGRCGGRWSGGEFFFRAAALLSKNKVYLRSFWDWDEIAEQMETRIYKHQ